MSDYECDHCDNFDPSIRHCKNRINCPYDEEDAEDDLIPGYADILPNQCTCGADPIVKRMPPYYWIRCSKCGRTTKVYVDSLGYSDSGLDRAVKEWNGGGK